MADKVRWGIISTAGIGKKRVIPAIQQSNNGEVVAISSRNMATAQAAAAELGIPKAYGSYEAMIESGEVDAIYNPLPNSQHAEWSIKCAEAGIPTLCEKPFASTAAEAQKMVDAFAQHKILFAEAFMYRFHPQTQRVKAMLEEGAIGLVKVINASFTFPLHDETNIRLSKTLAGGSLMDVGCYCVNVMRFMAGEEPVKAQAFAHIGQETGVDETLTGILEFPSGILGHFDSSLRTFGTNRYEIRGTGGKIAVEVGFVPSEDQETIIHWWYGDKYETITIPAVNQYTLMAEDFADALLNKRPPRFAPQDGVRNMQVIDKLLASLK